MQKSYLVILVAVVGLLAIDYSYFRESREVNEFGVNEAFLRKGSLGKILKKNGLVQVSSGTEALATNGMCAEDVALKGYDYHNTYRMRFKMHSLETTHVDVRVHFPKAKRYREVLHVIELRPGRNFYALDFVAHKGRDFHVTFTKSQKSQFILSDILVDGRYGRTQALLKSGDVKLGKFDKKMSFVTGIAEATGANNEANNVNDAISGVKFTPAMTGAVYSVLGGLGDDLYSGVFPGKNNEGFCQFVAAVPGKVAEVSQNVVPTVNLTVDEKYLYGDKGIIDNKEGKGRAWEVPAKYAVKNNQKSAQQQVGLRFHGGTPGRKKNINSFRINARASYGKKDIAIGPLMGRSRALGMKGVVFKYTYHAYDLQRRQYNPYNYALALDVAGVLGALVPAHSLVDLNINDENQGLYLALEHLSKRTIGHWLGKEKFKIFAYKKYNNEHQKFALLYPVGEILKRKGEDAFKLFVQSYDIDNVLNSVMLSAYISDDDYCQGVDVIETGDDGEPFAITSVNWDLDHAFISFTKGKYSMPFEREGIGQGFDILKENKTHAQSLCVRKWAYSHLYTQSKTFRTLVRERLESVLDNELSPENVDKMLDKYRKVDQGYYQGKHLSAIEEAAEYARNRPRILRENLTKLERLIEDGVSQR